MNRTLTVWMPNYNHGATIGRAIRAIANQSVLPTELVIIDDASTDNSREVIEEFQKKYAWLRVIWNANNKGVLPIMQQGVREIATDYVLMAAADDYILPGCIEAVLTAAKEYPNAGIIFGQMRVENENGKLLYTGQASSWKESRYVSPEEYMDEYLRVEAPTQSLSAASIYRMQALREIGGFREELGPWGDTFALQTMALKYGAYYIAEPLSTWVLFTASVSQGVRKRPRYMLAVISYAALLMKNPEFSRYYPAHYVRFWARRYRIAIWTQYILSRFRWLGGSRLSFNPKLQHYYRICLSYLQRS